MDSPNTHSITFYWRPGCGFCTMLERHLEAGDLSFERRNIWDDPDAAGFVRSVANGNETVPTVVVGKTAMVNPSIDQVVEVLSRLEPSGG